MVRCFTEDIERVKSLKLGSGMLPGLCRSPLNFLVRHTEEKSEITPCYQLLAKQLTFSLR